MKITCVILAAGQGQRFGGNKMLHKLPNGQTILQQTLDQYLPVFERVSVVVSPNIADSIQAVVSDKVTVVVCENADLGMSQSLVSGVAAHPEASGYLIALGDMPYVQTDTISRISTHIEHQSIVIPTCQGLRGNPVGFGAHYAPELKSLSGDVGAKAVTQRFENKVSLIEVADSGILHDIDLPADILDS